MFDSNWHKMMNWLLAIAMQDMAHRVSLQECKQLATANIDFASGIRPIWFNALHFNCKWLSSFSYNILDVMLSFSWKKVSDGREVKSVANDIVRFWGLVRHKLTIVYHVLVLDNCVGQNKLKQPYQVSSSFFFVDWECFFKKTSLVSHIKRYAKNICVAIILMWRKHYQTRKFTPWNSWL